MSSDSLKSNSPFDGEPSSEEALANALRSVRALAAGSFTVLGPLGRDLEGTFAFLARDLSANRLVVLKVTRASLETDAPVVLKVIPQLDASVPPPAGACPVCQTPMASWDTACPECGADLAGSDAPANQGLSPDELLSLVREVAQGYEVLGQMPRAVGGTPVYFARELQGGSIVALRLDRERRPGQRSGLTVAATRMMRPKLLYGSVGGAPRESGGPSSTGDPRWTSLPSPPPSRDPFAGSGSGGPAHFPSGAAPKMVCPQCNETYGPELRFCPRDGSALQAKEPPSDDLVGQIIAERYRILSKLGEGGMGRVYLAEHIRMGRRCAIKVMHGMLLYDPDSVSRFNREAANASGISHPNVAAIYDFGESDGLLYLAMELVQGESLSALLAREPVLTESRVIDIALQVVDALGAAHELGIVHRDLKPENIMITQSRDGRDVVKVVDFGIAKATKGEGRQTVTRTGFIVGTPAYMSPEQILGDVVDGRSDLYSLGCILYEMLTGQRAFLDASGEVSLRQRLTEPPPQPSRVKHGLSSHLNNLVTTAMARDPEQRFHSAAEVRDALIAARNAPSPVSWRDRLPWRRSPRPLAATAAPIRRPAPVPEPLGATAPARFGGGEPSRPALQRPTQRSTVVRPRSAVSARRDPAWLIAGSVVAVLIAFGAWRLLSPTSRRSAETATADSQIVLPATQAPASSNEAVPNTTPADASVTAAKDSAAIGTLRFTTPLPSDASVTVDGAGVRLSTDGSLSLAPGRHLLRIEAAGHQPWEQSIDIAAGKTEVTKARLVRVKPAAVATPRPVEPTPKPVEVPTTGTIRVTGTLPQGAEITLDGVTLAEGLRDIPAETGSHWLKISAPRYQPDSSQVEVTGGKEISWEAPALTAIPRVVTVEMATPDTTIPVGRIVPLRARARDDAGAELTDSLTWESGDAGIARVDRNGRVTAVGAGRTYIRAGIHDRADSTLVTVAAPPPKPKPVAAAPPPPAPPVPAPAARPPVEPKPALPAIPSAANIQAAVTACAAALGSRDERQIVQAYQPKTAQDVANLRKILELAIRPGAAFAATATAVSAPSSTPVGVDARVRFTWRNNAGVNKKKDAAFRVELNKGAAGWELAACRATEKVGF
jgi:serine/threonine protein kinase